MISFVWSSKYPFMAGAGGSENYTAGQVRELMRRGIPTRIITIGHGDNDGEADFPDIAFKAIKSKEELSELDDTLVFITYPLDVKTKRQSYVILHCPPPTFAHGDPLYKFEAFRGKRLIATSKFGAKLWQGYLGSSIKRIQVVYPFAEDTFGKVARGQGSSAGETKLLFAGRLTPDKGIYNLLASLHMESLQELNVKLTVTTTGSHSDDGKIILPMLQANPLVQVVPAQRSAKEMAELMAEHDVVVVPSTNIFWKEIFGIVSVEAQHAGCRVVASRAGGISEANCGGMVLVRPDDPQALARGIAKAAMLGPLTYTERAYAMRRFTVKESVDSLLRVIAPTYVAKKPLLHTDVKLIPHLAPQLSMFGDRLIQSTSLRERQARS